MLTIDGICISITIAEHSCMHIQSLESTETRNHALALKLVMRFDAQAHKRKDVFPTN